MDPMMRKHLPNFAAILIALLHGAMGLTAAMHESATFDEPAHFAAGYSYSLRNDYRLDPESGNLPQRWAALPLLLEKPRLIATDSHEWLNAETGNAGVEFLYDLGNDANHLLLLGRAMMTLVSTGVCLLVYFWSKRLWGSAGGLISVTVAAFSPTLLAHGALITSDVSVTLLLSAALWSYWALLKRVTLMRFLICGACLAGVFVAKMSGPLVLPMMALLLAFRVWNAGHVRCRRAPLLLAATAALALPVVAGIWATYGFRYSALAMEDSYRAELNHRWDDLLGDHTIASAATSFAREHKLLPEAYLYGLNVVRHDSDQRQAFLDGKWSFIGFGDFFPRAFLYKTPIALLLLILLATGAAVWWLRRRAGAADRFLDATPLVALVLVYGGFALGTGLNIGERHLLPMYPALFIACGGSALWLRERRVRVLAAAAVVLLLGWDVGESLRVRPHYFGYFSQFAGGPREGWRHLVDSSLDWGQDLPGLKRWLDHNRPDRPRPVYLAYFGAARPEWYGIDATALPQPSDTPRPLQPGLYCFSATALQQVYSLAMGPWCGKYEAVYHEVVNQLRARDAADPHPPDYWQQRVELFNSLRLARLCAALRHRKPVAQIGYSILVYDLNNTDLREAIAGPPAELFQLPQVAGR